MADISDVVSKLLGERKDTQQFKVALMPPHEFVKNYLATPTFCGFCAQFIAGITKQQQNAFVCKHCGLAIHDRCHDGAKDFRCNKNRRASLPTELPAHFALRNEIQHVVSDRV